LRKEVDVLKARIEKVESDLNALKGKLNVETECKRCGKKELALDTKTHERFCTNCGLVIPK